MEFKFNLLGKGLTRLLLFPFIFILIISLTPKVYGQAVNLDQIRNGPLGVYSTTPTADWVNGNAGPSNAHFAEGYSIPYRASVTGLIGNSQTVHHLQIMWDTKHSGGHAIDYITHYQNLDNPTGSHVATFGHTYEIVDPTLGTAFSGQSPSLFPILAPSSTGSEKLNQPTKSFTDLSGPLYTNNPNITKMAIWGGTITGMSYIREDAPDATTGQTETVLDIEFKSTNGSTALLAWAGHIAAEYDWGPGRGATGVSGSPYHTAIVQIDAKTIGQQDRSLKATAVIIPPAVCGISSAQLACPETPFLTFDATGSSVGSNISYVWTLTNGSTSAGAKIDPLTGNTSFTVKVVPIGTSFIAGGTFNLSLQVNKTGAQSANCSRTPAGTIQKVVVKATADPTTIDIRTASHSTTLTANIDASSTDPNNANYDYLWTVVTLGTTGSLTNANQRIATYTAGIGDAASTIQFKVVATQKSAPNCSNSDLTSVSVSTGPNCAVSPQGPVCQGTITLHNATPNTIFTGATYTWSLEAKGGGGTTTSTFADANGGVSMHVNANESYRIILTQVYPNKDIVLPPCYQDVTVDPTPSVKADYIAPPTCADRFFSVKVTNPVDGFTYTISQPGNSKTFTPITPSGGSPVVFTGLVPGDGYKVTVTSSVASCTASVTCDAGPALAPVTAKVAPNNLVTSTESIAKAAESYKIVIQAPTKVNAIPNPYTDKIQFNLVSAVSGYGSLELYNTLGQKVGVVYQGYIQAGKEINKEYNVSRQNRSTLIYVFNVGDQKVTGKLLGQK